MSEIDTKQNPIASERSNYRKSLQQSKENFDKRLNDIEERSETLNKKRDLLRNSSVKEAQDHYEGSLKEQKETMRENLLSTRQQMAEKMEKEKEIHSKTSSEQAKKYYQQLEDLNEGHLREVKDKDNSFQETVYQKNRNQEKVLKNQAAVASDSREKLRSNYVEKERGSLEEQREILKKIVKDGDLKVQSAREDERRKLVEARRGSKEAYENMKNTVEAEGLAKSKLYDNRLSGIQKNYQKANVENSTSNQEMIKNNAANYNREMKKATLAHQNEINELTSDFESRQKLEDYVKAREKQHQDLATQNKGLSPREARLVDQIDSYKEGNQKLSKEMDNIGADYADKLKNVNDAEKRTREEMLVSRDRSNQAFIDKTLIEERGKQEQVKRSLENKVTINKNESEITYNQMEKTLKNRIEALNKNYAATMKDVDEKHNYLVSNIKTQNKLDRKEYSEKIDRDFNDRQIESMKRNQNKLDLQAESFENQKVELDKKVAKKEDVFDTQLGRLRENSNYQMAVQYDIMNRQNEDTKLSLKENAQRKEDDLKSTIEILHSKYARKLDQQEQKFEKQMYALVQGYEGRIRHMSRESSRELAMKTNESLRDKKLLVAGNEMDKKRLVEYYENLLQNMRTNYEKEFSRVKSFIATSSENNSSGT
ncbi:MAG: hypothetical protein QE271_03610 [Bacteriovoracaceae bacterium]|nr:hypothetical protein [Bacteriovoracaceae bacterium]